MKKVRIGHRTGYAALPLAGFFAFSLTSLSIAVPATAQEQPPTIIKWATIAPENTVWGDIINRASREIEERSRGRIKHLWYFGAVMGDEPDTIRKLKLNQLHGLALLSVGLSKLAPEMLAYSLPFLFDNYADVDCVFEKTWPSVQKIFREKGYEVFGRADIGFSVLFSKNHLKTMEDFNQTRAWSWSGLEVDKAAALLYGIDNLIPLPLPEVLTALQTGMVDTVYATYYTAIALQWHTQIHYMSDAGKYGGAYAPAMLVLKKSVFDAISPEDQNILKEVCNKLFPTLRKQLRQDESNARDALLKRGIKMMKIDPVLFHEVKTERSRIIYQEWKEKYFPDWFFNEVIEARDQCREKLGPGEPSR